MTKKLIALTVIALLISSFSYTVAGDTDVQQASKKLAAISASRGIIDEMRSRNVPGLSEETRDEILDNTIKHSLKKDSEREIKTFLGTKFDKIIEKNLKDIHERFGITLNEQKFLDLVKNKYKNKLEDNRKHFLTTKGKEVFEAGREKAVSEQLKEISWEFYPDQEIVEDLYKEDWKTNLVDEKKKLLKEKKKKRVVGEELLEEVLKDLDQNLDKIFKHAKEQIVAQFSELNHEPGLDLITQEQFKGFWIKKVVDRIAIMTKNKQPGQMIYEDPFTSVSSRIETNANTEEQRRFRSFIKDTSFQVADSNFIIRTIDNEIEKHKNYPDSRALITDHFIENAEERFVNDYVSMAPEEERAGFKERLTEQHMSTVKGDIRTKVLKLIEPDLKKARRMIAARQLERHFPYLVDKSLELIGENEVIIKRIMVDQNLSVSTFGECMKSPVKEAINTGEVDTRELLDETESDVIDGMAFIVKEAKRAWDGQENIYLAHQGHIWDAVDEKKINIYNVVESKMSNNGPLDVSDREELLKYFTQKIELIWEKNRIMIIWPQERPSYADTKYIALFEHIKKEIEKALNNNIVKAIEGIKENELKITKEKLKKKIEHTRILFNKKRDSLDDVNSVKFNEALSEADRTYKSNDTKAMKVAIEKMGKTCNELEDISPPPLPGPFSEKPDPSGTTNVNKNNGKDVAPGTWDIIKSAWWFWLLIISLAAAVIYIILRMRRASQGHEKKLDKQEKNVAPGTWDNIKSARWFRQSLNYLKATGYKITWDNIKNALWFRPLIIFLALFLLASIAFNIILLSRWTFKPVLLETYIKNGDYFVYKWNNLEIVVEQESDKIPAPKQIHVKKAK